MIPSHALLIMGAYLVGSIPFGLLAGKLRGLDIRKHGSGNIGTTNVFRICGKELGITVFILDLLKGLVPVLCAQRFAPGTEGVIPILSGVGAIMGHNFPLWLKFKGGKGIATSAGVLGGLLPWALLFATLAWILTFVFTRYVSLASIASASALPVTVAISTFRSDGQRPLSYLIFAVLIGGLAIWRHRTNIQRLRAGTEPRFARKTSAS
ncbi:MAG: glycerol-3-phosphate acyltransferase PlsY [Verrucomicrobiales bacterium]|jgi:glycerol-3-phosphate acyltransferase PlsY